MSPRLSIGTPLLPAVFAVLTLSPLALLTGCRSNDQSSSPLWLYSYSTGSPSRWDSLLHQLSFLNLQPDGSYTQDFGRFDFGKWVLKGHDLYLTNQQNTTYIYMLPIISSNEMNVALSKGDLAYFEKRPRPSADPDKNPFSLDNNRWRLPASHKETPAEIRQRLLNHFHFWEMYFTWDDDNDVGALDVTHVPTPLKVYGNGFGLKHYSDLSPEWKSYFYDSVDCHTADTLIKGTFRRNNIKWPDTDDENKKLIGGIRQIESFLR